MYNLTRALVVVGLTLCGATARSQEQFHELWTVGNWHGYLFKTPAGYFERCAAIVHYEQGTTLGFGLEADSRLFLRVTDERMELIPGQPIDVALSIDGQFYGRVSGTASTRYQAVLSFNRRYELFTAVRRGQLMTMSGTLGSREFSLRDSSTALKRMAECLPGREVRRPGQTLSAMAPMPPELDPRGLGWDSAAEALGDRD